MLDGCTFAEIISRLDGLTDEQRVAFAVAAVKAMEKDANIEKFNHPLLTEARLSYENLLQRNYDQELHEKTLRLADCVEGLDEEEYLIGMFIEAYVKCIWTKGEPTGKRAYQTFYASYEVLRNSTIEERGSPFGDRAEMSGRELMDAMSDIDEMPPIRNFLGGISNVLRFLEQGTDD